MKVKAPKGYHFMKDGKTYKLMKHTGKFVKHKGASLTAELPVIKKHKWNHNLPKLKAELYNNGL